ncbi:unnamed protein product [Paramecium primaurelia]|uniref:Uncharacterized protein n=1 Tax=Paramecium primaurelia TaxID=5886 RepID=A0A8S1JT61_PARPR|nr:unnamed protein product [Paramecium primaurelia]
MTRSYSCHKRRLSEISNRQNNNDKNYIKIIESSRRNKFLDSKRKDIIKQQEIISENKRLLNKIVNIKSSFYCQSSRQSISSDCSKLSARSNEQKQMNVQRIKNNYLIKQKRFQIKATFQTIPIERTSRDQLRKPIYQIESIKQKQKCLQVQKINQLRLLSLSTLRNNNRVRISNSENIRIVNTLPEIKDKNYQIIARRLKDKLYNN